MLTIQKEVKFRNWSATQTFALLYFSEWSVPASPCRMFNFLDDIKNS